MLEISEGSPVDIRVTSGTGREPIRNQRVDVRQSHRYDRLEGGNKRSAEGVRYFRVYTGGDGVAHARALAGTELQISVHAGEWRSERQHVSVREDGVTLVNIHRAVDTLREVKGHLLAPPNADAELAGTEIVFRVDRWRNQTSAG